jgi:gas vesicle structural protein
MSIAYERSQVPASGLSPGSGRGVQKMGGSSSLAEVLNIILDKGIVIDAWARVSVVGIEILTIEARVVVASVETYLRYAEAIGLTALAAAPGQGNARQNGRGRGEERERELPSEDDIMGYLSDHNEGVRLGEMEAYFNVPRRELAEVINDLVDDDRVRRDDDTRLYFTADDDDDDQDDDD